MDRCGRVGIPSHGAAGRSPAGREPLLGEIPTHGVRILVRGGLAYAGLIRRHLLDAAGFRRLRNRILENRRTRWTNERSTGSSRLCAAASIGSSLAAPKHPPRWQGTRTSRTSPGSSRRMRSGSASTRRFRRLPPVFPCPWYPSGVRFTRSFETVKRRPDRADVALEWIERAVRSPVRRETVHNAFFDWSFSP